MSGCAVAAMSALAEKHKAGRRLSSQQIADARGLSQPLVAKVLTVLSRAGFVNGTRGPGGGYCLSREPSKISVYEVVDLFDGHRESSACPFGPDWCGVGDPCPLHDTLVRMTETASEELKKQSFAIFARQAKK